MDAPKLHRPPTEIEILIGRQSETFYVYNIDRISRADNIAILIFPPAIRDTISNSNFKLIEKILHTSHKRYRVYRRFPLKY